MCAGEIYALAANDPMPLTCFWAEVTSGQALEWHSFAWHIVLHCEVKARVSCQVICDAWQGRVWYIRL